MLWISIHVSLGVLLIFESLCVVLLMTVRLLPFFACPFWVDYVLMHPYSRKAHVGFINSFINSCFPLRSLFFLVWISLLFCKDLLALLLFFLALWFPLFPFWFPFLWSWNLSSALLMLLKLVSSVVFSLSDDIQHRSPTFTQQ